MIHPFPDRSAMASRALGRFGTAGSGPTIITVGGMHGNEPAGVIAIRSVLHYLAQNQPEFRGQIFGLTGNMKALKAGSRFLSHDLNRIWTSPDELPSDCRDLGEEREELEGLHQEITAILNEVRGPVILLDLHTTSAEGSPFMMVDDSQNIDEYKNYFPIPIITGLIDRLRGTLVHFMVHHGHRAVVFEGGQHEKISTLENMIGAIWILLVKLGCIPAHLVPEFDYFKQRLTADALGLPEILDVFYRHPVQADDQFEMEPGYFNFDFVRMGEILGHDKHGLIRAPQDARILMPLYQGQGNDGFFLGTEMTLSDWAIAETDLANA